MPGIARRLWSGAVPAAAASAVVCWICAVPRAVWAGQAAFVALALIASLVVARLPVIDGARLRRWLLAGAPLLCALPLVIESIRPARWIAAGPVSVYVAPAIVPLVLVCAARDVAGSGRAAIVALTSLVAMSFVLAAQPDLSQVAAVAAASLVLASRARLRWTSICVLLVALGGAVVAAYVQPDPLQPVPWVEQVVSVSWQSSPAAGIGVCLAALWLVWGLWREATGLPGMDAAAVYTAMLFGLAMADLTPAPLIGFGAGPWLGFGLLVGAATRLDVASSSRLRSSSPGRSR